MQKKGTCNVDSNQVRAFYCVTSGTEYPTREEFIDQCKRGGISCSTLLEQNQYEFPKDYHKRL